MYKTTLDVGKLTYLSTYRIVTRHARRLLLTGLVQDSSSY